MLECVCVLTALLTSSPVQRRLPKSIALPGRVSQLHWAARLRLLLLLLLVLLPLRMFLFLFLLLHGECGCRTPAHHPLAQRRRSLVSFCLGPSFSARQISRAVGCWLLLLLWFKLLLPAPHRTARTRCSHQGRRGHQQRMRLGRAM